MTRRYALIFLLVLVLPLMAVAKKPRTSGDAQRQKEKTEKQYAKTEKNLKKTEQELRQKLGKVASLESDIDITTKQIRTLKKQIDSIAELKSGVEDSIAVNEAQLESLRSAYVKAVRSSRKYRREISGLVFIFSADNFRQASHRMTYLREFSDWRQRKSAEIMTINAELQVRREHLTALLVQADSLRTAAQMQENRLQSSRKELSKAVGSLKGKQKQLNKMLKEQQQTLDRLDQEIDRLIQKEAEERRRKEEEERKRREAEERRRREQEQKAAKDGSPQPETKPADSEFKPIDSAAADKQASSDFMACKGKLPSPLSHTYVVAQGFGVQQHRSIKTLKVNNTGVDLETAHGASARAVFPGEITGVFMQKGLNYVVLVRHGEYLTVYANLQDIKVKKGAKVKTGDTLGTVAASPVNPDRSQLHFEIRREREKYDPVLWLK